MSGKRPADASSGTRRQLKQTKLSFFTSASSGQKKRPRAESEADQEGSRTIQAMTETTQRAVSGKDKSPDPSETDQSPNQPDTQTPDATTSSEPSQDLEPSQIPSPTLSLTTPTIPTTRIRITDKFGDLFSAPPSTLLIHACNCVGSWSGGIALAFRNLYPEAFKLYRAHCSRSTPDQLIGTALLIPPHPNSKTGATKGHWIGCLFTSRRYGKARDSPERILRATGPAMRDLMRHVAAEEEREGEAVIGEVRMCRINSGLFAVPWGRSRRAIEEMRLGKEEVPRCAEGGVLDVVAYERE
ncbi:hypothetical protein VTI74DRAFT_4982 [Chaetomium olivicolor]